VEVWRLEHPTDLDDTEAPLFVDGPDVPFHEGEI
jgi:hypothetical protein